MLGHSPRVMPAPVPRRSVWIGYDPREAGAYAVARESAHHHLKQQVPIYGVVLDVLKAHGLYTRPTSKIAGVLYDQISDAPMATEFACSRFLVPHLAGDGLALFMDADVLVRKNLDAIFALADPSKAVMVVKHNHQPISTVKMDGQVQTTYARKNWSSVCLFNCDHPANKALDLALVNSVAGRDLHRFCWLTDDEIGELPVTWNWLAGHSDPEVDPAIVHFTDGIPTIPGYEAAPYADEWRAELARWAK